MPEFLPVLSQEAIEKLVTDMGRRISADYADRELVLIGVLKGAFVFLADLIRRLDIPVAVDFVGTSSYGSQTVSSGRIELTKPVSVALQGKDVLIVEDIVDTGLTLAYLIAYVQSLGACSVNICAMIDKYERRQTPVDVQYACHRTDVGFLVGYGLDYDERYRELPGIYHLQF